MSKLYCKIQSDIRNQTGVRGDSFISAHISWNWNGSREEAGSIALHANHHEDRVKFSIVLAGANGEDKQVLLDFFTIHTDGTIETPEVTLP